MLGGRGRLLMLRGVQLRSMGLLVILDHRCVEGLAVNNYALLILHFTARKAAVICVPLTLEPANNAGLCLLGGMFRAQLVMYSIQTAALSVGQRWSNGSDTTSPSPWGIAPARGLLRNARRGSSTGRDAGSIPARCEIIFFLSVLA